MLLAYNIYEQFYQLVLYNLSTKFARCFLVEISRFNFQILNTLYYMLDMFFVITDMKYDITSI